ncbi:MAG: cytochrome C oxidase subunit IV family protein [bacterium]
MSANHAVDHHAADLDKHVRSALIVFGSLLALTVVTVVVAELDLPKREAIALALVIATIKGSLVAAYFMHLLSERKTIFAVLGLTVGFFFVLLLTPTATSIVDHVGKLTHPDKVAQPAGEHGAHAGH